MAGLTPINVVQAFPQQPVLGSELNVAKPVGKISISELSQAGLNGVGSLKAPQQVGFERILSEFVQQVNEKQEIANSTVNDLLSGKDVSLHRAVIAMEEANIAFSLMVEVRNKLVEAYQELMRMQI